MATQCVHTPVICHYSIIEKEQDLSRNKEQASKLETEMESTIKRLNKRPMLHRGAPEALHNPNTFHLSQLKQHIPRWDDGIFCWTRLCRGTPKNLAPKSYCNTVQICLTACNTGVVQPKSICNSLSVKLFWESLLGQFQQATDSACLLTMCMPKGAWLEMVSAVAGSYKLSHVHALSMATLFLSSDSSPSTALQP